MVWRVHRMSDYSISLVAQFLCPARHRLPKHTEAQSTILVRFTWQIKDAVAYEIERASVTLPSPTGFKFDIRISTDLIAKHAAGISQNRAFEQSQKKGLPICVQPTCSCNRCRVWFFHAAYPAHLPRLQVLLPHHPRQFRKTRP